MKSIAKNISRPAPSAIAARVDAIDWAHISAELDAQGSAVIDKLLDDSKNAPRSPHSIR